MVTNPIQCDDVDYTHISTRIGSAFQDEMRKELARKNSPIPSYNQHLRKIVDAFIEKADEEFPTVEWVVNSVDRNYVRGFVQYALPILKDLGITPVDGYVPNMNRLNLTFTHNSLVF